MPEIEFDPVDSIAAGAVGEPGQRAFYIQAEKDGKVLSVLVEKQQVAILAERVEMLLEQVTSDYPAMPGEDIPAPLAPDAGELRGDPVPLFRAVAIGIGFDASRRLVVLELHERPMAEDEDDEDDGDDEPAGILPGAESDEEGGRATSPACTSPPPRPGPWPPGAARRSDRGGPHARCAADHSTRRATPVPA